MSTAKPVKATHTNEKGLCQSCEDKLKLADPALADWFRRKVKKLKPDAHVSWSYRDERTQNEFVAEGKSKLAFPLSAHNKSPAEAIDLFRLCSNGMASWEWLWCKQIADSSPEMRWGGTFKSLGDYDHFEMKTGP